jgi:hypothetical protein
MVWNELTGNWARDVVHDYEVRDVVLLKEDSTDGPPARADWLLCSRTMEVSHFHRTGDHRLPISPYIRR